MKDNKFTIYMKSDLGVEFEDPRWDDLITYCEAALTKYIDVEKVKSKADFNYDFDLAQFGAEKYFMRSVIEYLSQWFGDWMHIEDSVAKSIMDTTCDFIEAYNTNYDVQYTDWYYNDLDDFWIEINGEEF